MKIESTAEFFDISIVLTSDIWEEVILNAVKIKCIIIII